MVRSHSADSCSDGARAPDHQPCAGEQLHWRTAVRGPNTTHFEDLRLAFRCYVVPIGTYADRNGD